MDVSSTVEQWYRRTSVVLRAEVHGGGWCRVRIELLTDGRVKRVPRQSWSLPTLWLRRLLIEEDEVSRGLEVLLILGWVLARCRLGFW